MPPINILLAVYNGQVYLPAALDSLLAQTLTDWELIAVDDASTDSSSAILAAYARQDSRIRVFTNPHNLGLTLSLNHGLEHCAAPYIARLDADDVALPNRLAQQAAYLDSHSEAVLVACDVDIINAAGQVIGQMQRAAQAHLMAWWLPFYNYIGAHSAVMVRRSALEQAGGGYHPERRYSQDYELWLRLAEVGQLAMLPQVLLQLRQHADNISQQHKNAQDDLSLRESQQALSRLYQEDISLEEVELLRAFWLEPFPPATFAPLIQHRLVGAYRAFTRQSAAHAALKDAISKAIGDQWVCWARAISLRHKPAPKLALLRYAAEWNPGSLLQEWRARF